MKAFLFIVITLFTFVGQAQNSLKTYSMVIDHIEKTKEFERFKETAFVDTYEFVFSSLIFINKINNFKKKKYDDTKLELNPFFDQPHKVRNKKLNIRFSNVVDNRIIVVITVPEFLKMPELKMLYELKEENLKPILIETQFSRQ